MSKVIDDDEIDLVAQVFAGRAGVGWERANCPLCVFRTGKEDERASLGLNFRTGGFVCHKCGARGWVPDVAPERFWDEEEDVVGPAPETEREVEPADGFVPLWCEPGATAFDTRWAIDYLGSRGVAWQAIFEAKIGCAIYGRLAMRVIVPHFAPSGKWAGWIGRDVTNQAKLRYRYSSGMQRDLLWNQQALALRTTEPLCLVEGVFDALPLWPHVAAFLGKPTNAHLETLKAHRGRPIVMLLDGDAWEESWARAKQLQFHGVQASFAKLPAGEDPGSLGKDRLREILSQAASEPPKL